MFGDFDDVFSDLSEFGVGTVVDDAVVQDPAGISNKRLSRK